MDVVSAVSASLVHSFAGAMGAIPSIPKRPREKYAAKIHPPVERSLTQLTEQMVAINEEPVAKKNLVWQSFLFEKDGEIRHSHMLHNMNHMNIKSREHLLSGQQDCCASKSSKDLSNQTSSSSWKRQPKAPGGLQDFAANPFLKPPTGESWVSSP